MGNNDKGGIGKATSFSKTAISGNTIELFLGIEVSINGDTNKGNKLIITKTPKPKYKGT